MFRSQTMLYYNILFSKENAVEVINELGNLGILDIEDNNGDVIDSLRPFH